MKCIWEYGKQYIQWKPMQNGAKQKLVRNNAYNEVKQTSRYYVLTIRANLFKQRKNIEQYFRNVDYRTWLVILDNMVEVANNLWRKTSSKEILQINRWIGWTKCNCKYTNIPIQTSHVAEISDLLKIFTKALSKMLTLDTMFQNLLC